MRRIDKVYNRLCAFKDREGVDANTLAEALGLARANVSFDLNRLFEEGRAMKLTGRPVRFLASVNVGSIQVNMESELDRLGKISPSLANVVDQAKAAILYPPKGMHSIILGETGVGKSMFANLMYRYAIESGVRGKNAPFIVFNCADYANNPQLLTAQLFGVKKGAFTGADTDREGLLEKADNGILFLDEVHRLPPEGQEALFVFLDKGDFRRVGDSECRTSNVLIITATTENPSSSLLKTFTRRIPMTLRVPSLKERAIDERLDLVKGFFNLEASRISQDIYISMNLMKALLIYDAPGNVGQLKNDIQIITAKAYAEFLTGKREKVELWSPDLPSYIKESLFNERVYRDIFNRLFEDDINGFTFGKGTKVHYLSTKENTIYDFIERKIGELKIRGIAETEIDSLMEGYISEFVKLYIHKNNEGLTKSNLANIVGTEILELSERVYSHAMERLSLVHNSNTFVALCLHLFTLLQRVKQGVSITNPQLNIIRRKYAEEYSVAMECLEIIRMNTSMDIYNDEAGFLALFWLQSDPELSARDKVRIVIIAHGESTATSMAGVTNKLLGENYAVPIDAPIEVKPQVILDRLRKYIGQNPTTEGYLLMVDMGSPTNFGKEIEKEYHTRVRMVPLVSTLHVLDATRKALSGTSLEEIYRDTLAITAASILPDYEVPEEDGMKFVIVTACLTGEGSSQVMKSFLKSNLRYNRNHLDIIAISAVDKESLEMKVRKINEESHVICVISSLPIQMDIRSYSLIDVLSLKAIKEIQDEIDLKSTIVSMDKVIKDVLVSIKEDGLNAKIYEVIRRMEEELRTTLPIDMLPGVIIHIACMMDRLVSKAAVAAFEGKTEYIALNQETHRVVRKNLERFAKPYGVELAEDEICFVMKFFEKEAIA
jgi:transcriptional regulator with AAA-type ATPase domain/transcriptional regulatory protein LevR